MRDVKKFFKDNIVSVVFALICVGAIIASQQTPFYLINAVVTRLSRYGILVFALIIPVTAGLGLNFGLVIGAMCAQAGLIFMFHWRIEGLPGLLAAFLIGFVASIITGWLLGTLFNKTKGQEMVTGMMTGYFANGIYQLIFLVLIGKVIPMVDDQLLLSNGIGIRSGVTFSDSTTKAIDNIWKVTFETAMYVVIGAAIAYLIAKLALQRSRDKRDGRVASYRPQIVRSAIIAVAMLAVAVMAKSIPSVDMALTMVKVPVVNFIITILVALLVKFLATTKLGQDFRTVGHSQPIAAAAGINVDRTRIIATIISTVLGCLGQLVMLQSLGNFDTYTAHNNVALFSIAALLVGGASIKKAGIGHGVLGMILFHTLFVVAPYASTNLVGDASVGEYFRTFVSYGVIAVSLVLHMSKAQREKRLGSGE